MLEISSARISGNAEKYLGLPSMVGKLKYKTFRGLEERVWKKVHYIFLSQTGKEVLIKAVIQSFPIFTMSVFKLPKRLCTDLFKIMANFWWGHKQLSKGIHWLNWTKMELSKNNGGLGFKDIESFNQAMLAK